MKADEYLEEKETDSRIVEHEPVESCEEAAEARGVDNSQIVKSLIVEAKGKKFHVLLPGDRELSESKFGSEHRLVPPEESREITGFKSGTVHPFSTELKHVIDERVFERQKLSHTTGDDTRGVILDSEDFRKAVEKSDFDFEVSDIAVSEEEDFKEIEEKGLGREEAKFVVNKGFRRVFLRLEEEFEAGRVLDLLKAFNREEVQPEKQLGAEVLKRAENQTHLQRLVETYSEEGELPEKEQFNLEEEVESLIKENPDAVEDFRSGKDSALNYLIGQLMQETNGKADAGEAKGMIQEKIED